MHALPKISVITPSFNQASFLDATIRSVLDQDYPDLEYIIVDGGSTDGSADIIRRYQDRLAWWVSEKDRGQTHAINKGFARATGNVICWLNSDDLFTPGALRAMGEAFAGSDADVIYGDYEMITSDGRLFLTKREIPFSFFLLLYGMNFIGQPSAFMKRSVLQRFGSPDESLHFMMDYEYWLRLASKGAKFRHIKKVLSRYRLHPASKTVALADRQVKEMDEVRRRFTQSGPASMAAKSILARTGRQVVKLFYQGTVDYFGGPLFKRAYQSFESQTRP